MAYKGIAYAAFAAGTYTDGSAPTYTGGKIFSKLCSANVSFNRSDAKLYADNGLHLTDNGITGGSVSITVASMDDDAQVQVLGLEKTGTGDNATYTETDDEAPIGGFAYVVTEEDDSGVDHYITYLIYKVQFGLESQDISTRGESTEFQTPSLNGNMMGVRIDSSRKMKYRTHMTFSTEAAALAQLKTYLSIT